MTGLGIIFFWVMSGGVGTDFNRLPSPLTADA